MTEIAGGRWRTAHVIFRGMEPFGVVLNASLSIAIVPSLPLLAVSPPHEIVSWRMADGNHEQRVER